MRSIIATLTVNVDVEDDATDEEVQEDARGVLIDLLSSGAEIEITADD
jgi:hypothetical protein